MEGEFSAHRLTEKVMISDVKVLSDSKKGN